ncbi:phosphonate ABC transporter substrate-binding protein [Falsiroseomonas tokyonensis]|uniref:Phosphonate ABC transporter substrate-binding protein n=1 Tax=Falsiroseomonas tokyonensis TaxID=430521 RepID=A0ABV7C135_9PROT|nr:phosphonate ABC transporter substrate-binding protein [Falsiroseomonas tokyonensis]MBU8541540.1 phosphonate ABC transporter substrate-binding protein [Falsiroseomonas tokyonensis]
MIRRRTLAAALLAPALAAPRLARAQSGWRANYRELRLGISSAENERDAVARQQPFQDYIQRTLGVPLRVYRATDYAGVVEALRSSNVEFARFGPATYALARRVMGERIIAFARDRDSEGGTGYHSVAFVKADSPYRRIEDLRGKSFAFADPNSTSGFAFPAYFLRKEGFDPTSFFGRTGFSGSHEQSVIAVLNGTYDAGATFWSNPTRGNIQRMEEKGMIQPGTTRIVWTSPLIPNSPWVMRGDLPADLRRDWAAAVFAMPERDPAAFAVAASGAIGLVETTHADYLDVIAVVEENLQRRRQRS